MNCEQAREQLHDFGRGRLDPPAHDAIADHLQRCEACAAAGRAEQLLDEILAERLPRHPAPPALKRRLAMIAGPQRVAAIEGPRRPVSDVTRRPRASHWMRVVAPALAASLVLATGAIVWTARAPGHRDLVTSEVVNDHLRVLASQHPLDVESGGTHNVKPWFEGKLDFAPDVPSGEGTDLRLRGGAVGYVLDRKAAVVVYGLRLHAVTLLVFPAEGLQLPGAAAARAPAIGHSSMRGFNVVWWRAGDLQYALVSDVNAAELSDLGARLARDAASRPAP